MGAGACCLPEKRDGVSQQAEGGAENDDRDTGKRHGEDSGDGAHLLHELLWSYRIVSSRSGTAGVAGRAVVFRI